MILKINKETIEEPKGRIFALMGNKLTMVSAYYDGRILGLPDGRNHITLTGKMLNLVKRKLTEHKRYIDHVQPTTKTGER